MSWRNGLRSGSDRFTPENRQAAIDLQESFRQASAARRAERNAAAAAAGASYSTGTTPAPSRPNTPPPAAMPNNVDFDAENKDDAATSQSEARSIKVEWDSTDVKFWFSQLEGEMLMASVGSQWLKKTILQRNLPNKQKEDVKAYLSLGKQEAGDSIYLDIKTELLRIYGPRPADSYKKALSRTMTGLPSQLGSQIIDDICKKNKKLEGCCCDQAAFALWSLQLPVSVRAHISGMEFNKTTYKNVFEAADKYFKSSKQVTVAAMRSDPNETLPAFEDQNQPQVAAFNQRGGRGGRGNRGGRGRGNRGGQRGGGSGGGSNGGSKPQGQGQARSDGARPPRHASNPPESCCDRHYQHGADAWYCTQPTTCPWVSRVKARP